MLKSLKAATVAAALTGLVSAGALAEEYGLGRVATPEEVKAWDIDIRPDGGGLPEGTGSVVDGEELYVERCAMCHGDFGEAVDRWPVLAGGDGTLASDDPVKTVGSYWPYLSTVWDYVHRAMPFGDAQSLTDDEVYAITAYILYLNDLVDEEFVLTRETFAEVEMPNADGFFPDDRMETAVWQNRTPCMTDCKPEVKITARARVIDVTPDDPTSKVRRDEGAAVAPAAEPAKEEPTAVVQVAAAEPDPALVAKGKKVFRKCQACHAVGEGAKHKLGPQLNGIVGRTAGTVDGFKKYSKAMVKAGEDGMVWDEATLTAFLTKPKAVVKKTKMSFAGLKKAEDLSAIIAYLQAHQE